MFRRIRRLLHLETKADKGYREWRRILDAEYHEGLKRPIREVEPVNVIGIRVDSNTFKIVREEVNSGVVTTEYQTMSDKSTKLVK